MMQGPSHFGANLEGLGTFFLICFVAFNTSCPSVKVIGCTIYVYDLAILYWHLWPFLVLLLTPPNLPTSFHYLCHLCLLRFLLVLHLV